MLAQGTERSGEESELSVVVDHVKTFDSIRYLSKSPPHIASHRPGTSWGSNPEFHLPCRNEVNVRNDDDSHIANDQISRSYCQNNPFIHQTYATSNRKVIVNSP